MITIGGEPEYVLYVGHVFTVEWFCDEAGKMPAKKYFDLLTGEEKIRLELIVKYMADSPIGTRIPGNYYNLEDSENRIYAFKPKDHRFFNFITHEKKIIIVNAYRKHAQQMAKKDLNILKTAIECKRDYLKRVNEGTYYERNAE